MLFRSHTGHVWSGAGGLLAEAEFTGETDSGWQEASFATPVPVYAGTTYVASYHTPDYYADDPNYFSLCLEGGPLRLLADGEDGPNGVFAYSGSTIFPTHSYTGSNYWVDVVFMPDDLTAPVVNAVWPASGSVGVGTGAAVTATFDELLDSASVRTATFELRDSGGDLVPASIRYDAASHAAHLIPLQPLADSTTYSARLHGGASGSRIHDLAANPLAGDVAWSFTTTFGGVLAVETPSPRALRLAAAPNPSRGSINLTLESPAGGYDALDLLDVTGRIVRRLGSGAASGGRWIVRWDGRDASGQRMPAGLYFARVRARSGTAVLRVALIP